MASSKIELIEAKNILPISTELKNLQWKIVKSGLEGHAKLIPELVETQKAKNKEMVAHFKWDQKELGKIQKEVFIWNGIKIQPYESLAVA